MEKESGMSFRFTEKQKLKMIFDSARHGFSSASAYLVELIERGLPPTDLIGEKLNGLDNKLDSMTSQKEELQDIKKRVYIIYRISAYLLARSFLIKPGAISEREIEEANRFIESEVKKMGNRFN